MLLHASWVMSIVLTQLDGDPLREYRDAAILQRGAEAGHTHRLLARAIELGVWV